MSSETKLEHLQLSDPEQARRYVLQTLWLARAAIPSPATIPAALDLSLEIASAGHPLPMLGFVADVGHLAQSHGAAVVEPGASHVPGIDSSLLRRYEDYVLGKLYADPTFQRGGDALLQYQGRDRQRGMSYLLEQFRQRANIPGVDLSPGVIRSLKDLPAQELLAEGWRLIEEQGWPPDVLPRFERLIDAVRDSGDVLGVEDLVELEQGVALAEFSQRLAFRQVVSAARGMEENLPNYKTPHAHRRRQIATHLLQEDMYPVGGYTSLSTRGTLESMLQSQLALMETDQRPDLFDIKFLRNELLYYSRDENQFFRRRRSIVLILSSDLVSARFKDAELPAQRIVFVLALLEALLRKLRDWLGDEALTFYLQFVGAPAKALSDERRLLEMLLREQIAGGSAFFADGTLASAGRQADELARRSLCQVLVVSQQPIPLNCQFAEVTGLGVDGPRPSLRVEEASLELEADSAEDHWRQCLAALLRHWV